MIYLTYLQTFNKMHFLLTKIIIIAGILFSSFFLEKTDAQFYQYGQDPSSLKWKYTESEHFKLIHPLGFENNARELLGILNNYYLPNSAQLDHKPKKIPIVLHSSTVNSNGFVTWAPKRMEFFTYPDVNGIAQDWYTHLSLHEFRHAVQVDKLNQGTSKVLTTILGEQGIAPAAGMLGFWFLEGDAVYAETSLSNSGRGRDPTFEMQLKSHLLTDKKPYSYAKSYLGSYKDFVSSYYSYGYQMVSYARQEYGNEIWSDALNYVGRKPYLINPLYFFMKKRTGGNKDKLYGHTMSFLKNHWRNEIENRPSDTPQPVNSEEHKYYTSYRSPQLLPDSSVIAIKSGFQVLNRFVRVYPDGKEEIIHLPGYLNSGRINYSNKKLVWDEFTPDLRWTNRSFSNLFLYNIENDKLTRLTTTARYSSPALSTSGDTIVAVETNMNNEFYLIFLNDSGKFLSRYSAPENMQLQDPAWVKNTNKIIAITVDKEGKKLMCFDMAKQEWELLFDSHNVNISRPVSDGNRIIFHGSFTGIDEIYALELPEKILHKLTNSGFGAFQPDVLDNRISWSYYTNEGYNLATKPLVNSFSEVFKIPAKVTEQPFFSYSDSSLVKLPFIETHYDTAGFKTGRYSKLGHLFQVHSWAPYWFDYNNPDFGNIQVSPGVTILSQNLLTTATSYLGYELKNKESYLHAGITYKGGVPVLDFSLTWGGTSDIRHYSDEVPPIPGKDLRYNLLSYIPIRFTNGQWSSGFQPALKFSYKKTYFFYENDQEYKPGLALLEPRFYAYFFQRTAYLDLIPRWGSIIDLKVVSSPFEDEQLGEIFSLKSTFYFPGLRRNDGLRIQFQGQRQTGLKRYLFSNNIGFSRGYDDLTAISLSKYSADYMGPLAYPDLNLFNLLYLKRIKSSIFVDYLYGKDVYVPKDNSFEKLNTSFLSYGIELTFDYHPFRMLVPLSTGIRAGYLERNKSFFFDLIFSVDLGF